MPYTFARWGILVFLPVILVFSSVRVVHAPPVPVTLQAANITATSAVLNGLVTTNGQTTEWWFLVREGSAYSQNEVRCPQQTVITPGSVPVQAVMYTMTGLKPSTTYFFNLFVAWAGSTGWGGVWTSFATLTTATTKTVYLDMALTSGTLSPSTPKVGDQITFQVVLTITGTNIPLPFPVFIQTSLDGNVISSRTVNYAGPSGTPMPVASTTPWTATAGTHTVEWSGIIMGGDANTICQDNYPSNNKVPLTFTVGAGVSFDFTLGLSPGSVLVKQGGTASFKILLTYSDLSYSGTVIDIQVTGLGSGMNWQLTQAGDLTITTSPTTPTGPYTVTVIGSAKGVTRQVTATLTVASEQTTTQTQSTTTPTQTVTQTQITTSVQTVASVPSVTLVQTVTQTLTTAAPLFAIQQSDLLLLGLGGLVVVLLVALLLQRSKRMLHKPSAPAAPPPSLQVSGLFCMSCGSPIPSGAEFCPKCGARKG